MWSKRDRDGPVGSEEVSRKKAGRNIGGCIERWMPVAIDTDSAAIGSTVPPHARSSHIPIEYIHLTEPVECNISISNVRRAKDDVQVQANRDMMLRVRLRLISRMLAEPKRD